MEKIDFAKASKAKRLERFFRMHGRIYIVVDSSRKDVILPEHIKGNPALNLVLNTNMPQLIHINAERLCSRFSFGGQASDCTIPMDAIWAAFIPEGNIEDGLLWDEAIPSVVRKTYDDAIVQASEEEKVVAENFIPEKKEKPAGEAKRPFLRVVK